MNWQILVSTAFSAILMASCGIGKIGPVSVSSPDGGLTATVTTEGGENGRTLSYSILFNGYPVISNSSLGIALEDNERICEKMKITGVVTSSASETYQMAYGKSLDMTNKYQEAIITLENSKGRAMDVIIRAFDDGIAFRYRLPKMTNDPEMTISGECTSFSFNGDHPFWGLELESYTTSYETDYTISTISQIPDTSHVALPLLVKAADAVWVAITEANLTDYAGMYLRNSPLGKTRLDADLSPLPDGSGRKAVVKTPFATPWRVIMVADDPGRFIESNIVLNLNAPCTIDDSWIEPGRTAWDWWSGQIVDGFEGSMDNRTMKKFIDFAGDYGLEYMLVDAEWYGPHTDADADITTSIPDIDVPELVSYGQERGVGILLWLNWRNVDRQMDEAFPLYEKWGVKGVKVDYMNRDDQEMVNFYRRVVEKAAEHHLLVDFHGAYKPTGIRRTYPNLITREGVMGLEYLKWSNRTTPEHNCILPFTRMLAGPMDYTPGGFNNVTREEFKPRMKNPMTLGTRCHQIALYVIFESPLQMLADSPVNYRGEPGMDFLEQTPATWDETHVYHAQVGDYVTIARRQDDEWFIGSITDWTPRDLELPLGFLGNGDYEAVFYTDAPDADSKPKHLVRREILVRSEDTLKWHMAPGGGMAVRIYPAPDNSTFERYRGN